MSFPGRAQELFRTVNSDNNNENQKILNGLYGDDETTRTKPTGNNNNDDDANTNTKKKRKQLAAFFLVALTLENTGSMLARRYAVGVLQLDFSKNVVLCANEFMTLAFSIFMKYRKMDVKSFTRLKKHVEMVVKTATPMLVPGFVYLVVNLISYPSLQRVDASVFTAISNLKVLLDNKNVFLCA